MKKVLHVNTNKIWRGGEQQVHYLLNHSSSEYDKYLFCPEHSPLYLKNISSKKNKLFTYKKRFGFDISGAVKLKKVCQENSIDLIHLHDSHALNLYLTADFLGMNIPCIFHRHVNFNITSKWKYAHKKIQKIICVSEEVKKTLSGFINKEKLVVVHPGTDIKKYIHTTAENINLLKQELNLVNETKLIGIVSSLEKEKNMEEFIEIANRLIEKNKNYHFIIIGDGSLKSEYSNLNAQIHLLGFRNDIPEILSCLDIFLFTSKNEGFGQVLIEAMAAGVPIVTSNFAAANEIITNGKNGFIYKDVEYTLQIIEKILTTNELRQTTIENAFHFVQQFDLSLMNEKIETVYSSLNIEH